MRREAVGSILLPDHLLLVVTLRGGGGRAEAKLDAGIATSVPTAPVWRHYLPAGCRAPWHLRDVGTDRARLALDIRMFDGSGRVS